MGYVMAEWCSSGIRRSRVSVTDCCVHRFCGINTHECGLNTYCMCGLNAREAESGSERGKDRQPEEEREAETCSARQRCAE